jgi:hypothetical protein
MVAVAAAAFALDALYAKINAMLEPAARPRVGARVRRAARVGETLKAALELGGRATSWQARIPALFELRDDLVHFEGTPYRGKPAPDR